MHLVVLLHGLGSSAYDLRFFASKFNLEGTIAFAPTTNEGLTTRGIHACATRVLIELERQLVLYPAVNQLSVIGHSYGGLYGRRLMYIANKTDSPIAHLEYINFVTLATPHVGSRDHAKLMTDTAVDWITPLILGQTGKELMLIDGNDAGTPPILEWMTSDEHLYQLKRFKHLFIYSNAINDLPVHYCSSALRRYNPWKDVSSYMPSGTILNDVAPRPYEEFGSNDDAVTVIRRRLNTLPWQKYVCFFSQPFMAHVHMINKAYFNPFADGVWTGENPLIEHLFNVLLLD
jgi:Putative serine esterase (DUF676)